MTNEPRHEDEYSPRQIQAAHRVLVDLGQVLASFKNCLVVVGGWVPDLLLPDSPEPHIGSIDVDLALNAEKLSEGRYAKLIETLLNSGRYFQSDEAFKLYIEIDLKDGEKSVRVDVDFLKSSDVKLKKNKPNLVPGFRPLDAKGCAAAFNHPELAVLAGQMAKGAKNKVQLWVASIPDFLVMKAFAVAGRDKPKDAYDICFCLDNFHGGRTALAEAWNLTPRKKYISDAIAILKEKFSTVDDYGPSQVVEFHNSTDPDERAQQQRRAFELVQDFLRMIHD